MRQAADHSTSIVFATCLDFNIPLPRNTNTNHGGTERGGRKMDGNDTHDMFEGVFCETRMYPFKLL